MTAKNGACLDGDIEDLGLVVVKPEQRTRQNQVAGRRDRQELGQPLDHPHDGRLDQQHDIHTHSLKARGLSLRPAQAWPATPWDKPAGLEYWPDCLARLFGNRVELQLHRARHHLERARLIAPALGGRQVLFGQPVNHLVAQQVFGQQTTDPVGVVLVGRRHAGHLNTLYPHVGQPQTCRRQARSEVRT